MPPPHLLLSVCVCEYMHVQALTPVLSLSLVNYVSLSLVLLPHWLSDVPLAPLSPAALRKDLKSLSFSVYVPRCGDQFGQAACTACVLPYFSMKVVHVVIDIRVRPI